MKVFFKTHCFWIIPVEAIILSFSLYENPFLKTINVFLLPFLLFFFLSYAKTLIEGNGSWNAILLQKILKRKISLPDGKKAIIESVQYEDQKKETLKKLLTGGAILIGINLILIPLLASADKQF